MRIGSMSFLEGAVEFLDSMEDYLRVEEKISSGFEVVFVDASIVAVWCMSRIT